MTSSTSSPSPIRPLFISLIQTQILSCSRFQNFTTPEEEFSSGKGDLFMSESEHREHESEHGDGGNGEEDDEKREGGDGRESEVDERRKELERRRKGYFGLSRDFRNAIKRPFSKRRNRRKEEEKERVDVEIIKPPSAVGRRKRKKFSGGGVGGCYVCFMRPGTVESPETPTSDPNSESFSFEMLRTLIEKNDFYCKECNPHI